MRCNILRSYKIKNESNISLLNQAIELIEGHILFTNEFFTGYEKRTISPRVEHKWLLQRTFLSKNFPRYYANIISKSNDLEFIKPLVDQLWEELGNGHNGRIHYDQLVESMNILGISNIEIFRETPDNGTVKMLETYQKWTNHENPIVGAGVFGIAIEPIISMDCHLSIKGLRTNHNLSDDEIRYFIDHEGHDYRHSYEILDVVFPRISCETEIKLILQGTNEVLDSRNNFYNSIIKQST